MWSWKKVLSLYLYVYERKWKMIYDTWRDGRNWYTVHGVTGGTEELIYDIWCDGKNWYTIHGVMGRPKICYVVWWEVLSTNCCVCLKLEWNCSITWILATGIWWRFVFRRWRGIWPLLGKTRGVGAGIYIGLQYAIKKRWVELLHGLQNFRSGLGFNL